MSFSNNICTPATLLSPEVKMIPISVSGHLFHRQYLAQLYAAAKTPGWNIRKEMEHAVDMDTDHQMLLLAFIAESAFSSASVSFAPFQEIDNDKLPTQCNVLERFQRFSSGELPTSLKLTSTLLRSLNNTIFVNPPYKVIQYAELDPTTFKLSYTHAELYKAEGTEPIRYTGQFVPAEHLA